MTCTGMSQKTSYIIPPVVPKARVLSFSNPYTRQANCGRVLTNRHRNFALGVAKCSLRTLASSFLR